MGAVRIQDTRITREGMMNTMEEELDALYEAYQSQLDDYGKYSLHAQLGIVDDWQLYALGKQLHAWEEYLYSRANGLITEAQGGSITDLGTLPNIALDVITVGYGASIIPLIATVQPIDDEKGTVWFEELKAVDTRGSLTAEDVIMSAKSGMAATPTYASDLTAASALGNTTTGTLTYNALSALANLPIIKGQVIVTISDLSLTAKDFEQDGVLLGAGIQGTVNYTTGAVTLVLGADPLGTYAITCQYRQDMEGADDVPQVKLELTSITIEARVFALKTVGGMLKNWALQKRFGRLNEQAMAQSLASEMNAEVGGALIKELYDNIPGGNSVTWDRTRPTTVSELDHREGFRFTLSALGAKIVSSAGRGVVNALVLGIDAAAYVESLNGFVPMYQSGASIGPHLYGQYRGITVIRSPQTTIIPQWFGMALYKGVSQFDAPACYAPFMPLAMTDVLGTDNPIMSQQAAVVWAGIKSLIPNYTSKLEITAS